jgi:hypothetical protein
MSGRSERVGRRDPERQAAFRYLWSKAAIPITAKYAMAACAHIRHPELQSPDPESGHAFRLAGAHGH